jgi:organic radical activating enzyme
MNKSPAVKAKAKRLRPERHVFRGPRTLSVMPTFTCPAACTDCGTLSSPQERTRLNIDRILETIDEAKEIGFYNVVFTGGEATLRWAELLRGIRHAHDLGFPVRLVTNAHWATDLDTTREKLAELIDHGLSEINYSTGDEHMRFIPLERVVYGIVAACERAFRVHVMVEMKKESGITRSTVMEQPLIAQMTEEQHRWLSVVASPWMPLSHTASYQYPEGNAVTRENLGVRSGCDSVLQTYTVQADGRIGACCGLGLRAINELNVTRAEQPERLRQAIIESEADFLKLWIHYWGPEKIVRGPPGTIRPSNGKASIPITANSASAFITTTRYGKSSSIIGKKSSARSSRRHGSTR